MKVNVLGYGIMAKQIAALLYNVGYEVCIWSHRPVDVVEVQKQIKLLGRYMVTDLTGTITFTNSLDQLEDAVTIESVVEDLDVKKEIYSLLKDKISKGYYSNTSSYSPSEIGELVGGAHFYNPVTLKLVELYIPGTVCRDGMDAICETLNSVGFEIVKVNENRGYIGNYILFQEISIALKLMEKFDYNLESVNSIYCKLYDGRNIFTIIDLIGIDIVYKILINLKEEDDTIYMPQCLAKAIKQGILGRKNRTSIRTVLN